MSYSVSIIIVFSHGQFLCFIKNDPMESEDTEPGSSRVDNTEPGSSRVDDTEAGTSRVDNTSANQVSFKIVLV